MLCVLNPKQMLQYFSICPKLFFLRPFQLQAQFWIKTDVKWLISVLMPQTCCIIETIFLDIFVVFTNLIFLDEFSML